MPSSHFVYLLECRDGSFYCGCTLNLTERLKLHNSGKGAKYTRARTPVKVVYSEKFKSRSAALKRELRVKRLSRKQKLELVKGKATGF